MSLLAISKSCRALKVGIASLPYGVIPAAVVASAFLLDDTSILLVLAIPALAAVVWRCPHLALWIILLSFMIAEGLYGSAEIVPRQITWLSDITILVLAAKLFFTPQIRCKNVRDPLRIPILLLLIVFVSSTLLNHVDPIVTLVAIRQYFKYVILYWVIIRLPISSRYILASFKFLIFLILIQIPIILIAFMLGFREDALSGGLGEGGTTPLVVMCIFGASVFFSTYVHKGKFSSLIKLPGILLIPAISEIKIGFVLLPVSVILIALLSMSTNFKRCVIIVSILIVSLSGMIITYSSIYPGTIQKFTSYSGLVEYGFHEEQAPDSTSNQDVLGRLAQLHIALSVFSKNMVTALIGFGPGETLDSYFEAAKGRWSTSLLGAASHNQFSLVLLELGLSGLLISIWVMAWLAYGLLKMYRSTSAVEDKELSCALFASAIVLIVCMLYMNVIFITDATAFLFWVSAAYLSLSMNKPNNKTHLIQHKLFRPIRSRKSIE